MQVKASSHVFLDFLIRGKIMLRSRVMARFAYLECLVAFSEQCVTKLVHGVLLLSTLLSS